MDEHIERWMTLVVPPVLKRIEQLGYADQAAVIAASKASQPTVASFMGTGDIDRIPKRPRNGTLEFVRSAHPGHHTLGVLHSSFNWLSRG